MRLKKSLAAGMVMSGLLLAQGLLATPVMAATAQKALVTHVYMDGTNVSNPAHVTAVDPSSGVETSYVPLYYLTQALKSVGVTTQWNGQDLTLIAPSSWQVPTGEAPQTRQLKANEMAFIVNGTQYQVAPKLVRKDPASGVQTTYVPVYYVNQFLQNHFAVQGNWDGQNWTLNEQSVLTPSSVVNQVMQATTEVGDSQENFAMPSKQVVVSDGNGGYLTAVVGTRNPTADGYGQLVFFFHNNQFIGLNATTEAAQINSVKPNAKHGFVVTYANYAKDDPMVAPSLPPQSVTYTWNGQQMSPSAALAAGVTNGIEVQAPAADGQ
jgi:hypothetical protein